MSERKCKKCLSDTGIPGKTYVVWGEQYYLCGICCSVKDKIPPCHENIFFLTDASERPEIKDHISVPLWGMFKGREMRSKLIKGFDN